MSALASYRERLEQLPFMNGGRRALSLAEACWVLCAIIKDRARPKRAIDQSSPRNMASAIRNFCGAAGPLFVKDAPALEAIMRQGEARGLPGEITPAGRFLAELLRRNAFPAARNTSRDLSFAQAQALRAILEGERNAKTRKQIAKELGIATRTLASTANRARKKLGCKNPRQAMLNYFGIDESRAPLGTLLPDQRELERLKRFWLTASPGTRKAFVDWANHQVWAWRFRQ